MTIWSRKVRLISCLGAMSFCAVLVLSVSAPGATPDPVTRQQAEDPVPGHTKAAEPTAGVVERFDPCRDNDPSCVDESAGTPPAKPTAPAVEKPVKTRVKKGVHKRTVQHKKPVTRTSGHKNTKKSAVKTTSSADEAVNSRIPAIPKRQAVCGGIRLTMAQVIEELKGGKNLSGLNLEGLDLRGVNLQGVNFSGACLASVCFERASMVGANLRRSILSGANLTMATLQGANLEGARIDKAVFDGAIWTDGHLCPDGSIGRCPDIFDAPGP